MTKSEILRHLDALADHLNHEKCRELEGLKREIQKLGDVEVPAGGVVSIKSGTHGGSFFRRFFE